MTIFKKSLLTLSAAALIFSVMLILLIIAFCNYIYDERNFLPLIFILCLLFAAIFAAIYTFSRSLSSSFGRLAKIVKEGAALLSDSEEEPLLTEFTGLEIAMNEITTEVSRRFEQASSESARLSAILNGMSEAVFAMDSTLKLHLVNPKARELFNLGDRDITTMSLLEAVRSTELVETAKKALSGGVPVEVEITFHAGTEQQLQVHASPLVKTGGNGNSGVVLVLQEITRLVKLERIRKDFVANVSHELRTPIQLIKGFSETLLDTVTEKQDIHFLEIIYKNSGIMENLTNDLLILADLENNTDTRNMEELDVSLLINEAVSSVEPQAKKKQTEIIVKCQEDLKANLFGSLIIQALINLIDNGIKYSPGKSKLWVSASLRGEKNDELLFEVRDTGIGISSEHQQRIFERFYRVDRARSREAGGTGLGLSIVRHIALLHKGIAEVESHAGEGSVFRIRLPVNQTTLHQKQSQASQP
ncbi:MAG: PAS domain-containing protein [Treponema sp.]|jgi:two-component system phosphate regulon sensor histidine kinase PhoR|nr:PAS domain-containing protein [Treponema sp.]